MNIRLVNLDDLLETLYKYYPEYWDEIMEEFPTVDAVPVVRCKDCRWCRHLESATGNYSLLVCGYKNAHGMVVNETGYCAWGERKDGAE